MSSFRISLTASIENGEGRIPPKQEAAIREAIEANPLWAADVLQDWVCDLDRLYWEARAAMREEWQQRKAQRPRE